MRLSTLVTEINTRALIGSHCPICLPGLVAVETMPSWTSGRSASGARLDGFGPSLALQRRPAQGNKSHLLLAWVYCPPTLHKGERTSRAGEGHPLGSIPEASGRTGLPTFHRQRVALRTVVFTVSANVSTVSTPPSLQTLGVNTGTIERIETYGAHLLGLVSHGCVARSHQPDDL